MVVYVFSLGFHADHVIRRLSRARDVEDVYVFTGRPATKAVYNAFQEVVAFCEKALYPAPKLYELSIEDPASSVYTVVSLLKDYSHIVADVGGGLRGVISILMTALFILSRRSFIDLYVYGEREDAPETYIPLQTVYQIVTGGFSDEKIRILEALSRNSEGLGIGDLVSLLGRSERTVRAHLSDLKRVGAITVAGDKISLTSWGKAIPVLLRL